MQRLVLVKKGACNTKGKPVTDANNVGQLASLLTSVVASTVSLSDQGHQMTVEALRAGATWTIDGVLTGIQDFILSTESGLIRNETHSPSYLADMCLSEGALNAMNDVELTMTVAHYVRLVLQSYYLQLGAHSARALVRSIIYAAQPAKMEALSSCSTNK